MKILKLFLFLSFLTVTQAAFADEKEGEIYCPTIITSNRATPILRSLSNINFYLKVLPDSVFYSEGYVLRCHGKQIPCDDPAVAEKVYDSYPKALLPEKVTALFVEQIRNNLASLFRDPVQCKKPPINVINDAPTQYCVDAYTTEEKVSCSRKRVVDYINNPDDLTVYVYISIENGSPPSETTPRKALEPRIAIVSANLVRLGCNFEKLNFLAPHILLPLALSEEEMTEKIKSFALQFGHNLQAWQDDAGGRYSQCIPKNDLDECHVKVRDFWGR